jgi:hypothetical protein
MTEAKEEVHLYAFMDSQNVQSFDFLRQTVMSSDARLNGQIIMEYHIHAYHVLTGRLNLARLDLFKHLAPAGNTFY